MGVIDLPTEQIKCSNVLQKDGNDKNAVTEIVTKID